VSSLLDTLAELGVVRPLDRRFARMLGRRAGIDDDPVLAAAALAGSLPMSGHVCLDLDGIDDLLDAEVRRVRNEAEEDGDAGPLGLPSPPEWDRALKRAAEVVRTPGEDRPTPLVLSDRRLYLDRYWAWQRRLASAGRARVAPPLDVDPSRLEAALGRVFADDPRVERQRRAVATSVLGSLSVIAGGPGTGKTAVVVRLLAVLNELARQAGRALPRVALVAPTGKAAARLTESIRSTRDAWLPEDLRVGVVDDASTIHRCLGINPRTGHPRHHADNPLPIDVLVVDEASMVDLPLMARLLAALPPQARLVLLGDPDQLVSVEMGSVLGDIRAAAAGPVSRPAAQALASVGIRVPPEEIGAGDEPLLADRLTVLDFTWRFSGAIGELASAINGGDAAGAVSVLREGREAIHLEQEEGSGRRGLHALLRDRVVAGYTQLVQAREPRGALDALKAFRVLCAHRRGVWGVESVNTAIEGWLADVGLLRRDGAWYVGRPVMVLRNDPRRGLYNGDVGVVLEDAATGERRAWFDGSDGAPRSFTLGALPDHETVFATTVHKSQGSEYDEVMVVLPDRDSPLLTRELLYTAVTRASRRVTVVGREDLVVDAVGRPTRRMSGLRAELS